MPGLSFRKIAKDVRCRRSGIWCQTPHRQGVCIMHVVKKDPPASAAKDLACYLGGVSEWSINCKYPRAWKPLFWYDEIWLNASQPDRSHRKSFPSATAWSSDDESSRGPEIGRAHV